MLLCYRAKVEVSESTERTEWFNRCFFMLKIIWSRRLYEKREKEKFSRKSILDSVLYFGCPYGFRSARICGGERNDVGQVFRNHERFLWKVDRNKHGNSGDDVRDCFDCKNGIKKSKNGRRSDGLDQTHHYYLDIA